MSAMGELKLTALVWREGRKYVSLCPQVDVSSYGKTAREALANLREAVELHFEGKKHAAIPHKYARCTFIRVPVPG